MPWLRGDVVAGIRANGGPAPAWRVQPEYWRSLTPLLQPWRWAGQYHHPPQREWRCRHRRSRSTEGRLPAAFPLPVAAFRSVSLAPHTWLAFGAGPRECLSYTPPLGEFKEHSKDRQR